MSPSDNHIDSATEVARLAALDSYRILDTAPEPAFDDIVRIAAEICGTPMALISLVDDRRQWFKAAVGLAVTETPRSIAFCAHAIRQTEVLLVEDAARDERFASNPLVTGDPKLRFYAGAPLLTASGHALGTLCVLDRQPGSLSKTQSLALQALSRQVMVQLELRKALSDTRSSEQRLRRAQEAGGIGLFSIDLASNTLSGTPEFWRIYGLAVADGCSAACVSDLVIPQDQGAVSSERSRAEGSAPLETEYRIARPPTGETRWIARKAEFERDAQGRQVRMVGVVRDVTERRVAQLAAKESILQFGAFTQTLPNHVWTATAKGVASWFNERLFEYTGLPREAANGTGWWQALHDDDRSQAQARWAQSLERGEVFEMELRLRRADGAYRWHLTRALPVVGADGGIIRWIGTNTDIHERKLIEVDALRARDRMWALSQEVMLICDLEGVIQAVNPSALRLLGYAESDMVGHNVLEFILEQDHRNTTAELTQLSKGRSVSIVNRYRTKQGGHRVLDWTAVPEEGRVHAVARDITKERAASADREHIWNSTNDLMATLGKDGYLKAVNPAWKRLLGYAEEELLARPLIQHIVPEDRPKLEEVLGRLQSGEMVVNLEDHLLHKDGVQSLMAWSAEPVGDLYYIVGRNVTEQRATEDALRQSLKMEAVGQLTGGIAHDFNNLLQGITGSLDLIRKRTVQGRHEDVERHVAGAMASAGRAAALTHRLLAFSRRQPLNPKPLEVNPLLTSMEDMLRRTLGEHIELKIAPAADLWLTKCDRNQLENAILNLVINARDAMPDGGLLTVETDNIRLDRAYAARTRDVEAGPYVCVSVTDTGAGMSADTITKAFEPFFTTKPLGRGTGLGLSMIYGFIRQSGGHAKIYSELGKGTTVRLYLPRFRGDAAAKDEAVGLQNMPGALRHETVLVIEDERVVRELILEILQELGYRTLQADDGPSGLKLMQSTQRIDLVITDIGLPGLNGRQIVEAAKLQHPDLRVLFMTGYAENAAIAAGFLEPGMSMITKPFAMEALAGRIREMLGEH